MLVVARLFFDNFHVSRTLSWPAACFGSEFHVDGSSCITSASGVLVESRPVPVVDPSPPLSKEAKGLQAPPHTALAMEVTFDVVLLEQHSACSGGGENLQTCDDA